MLLLHGGSVKIVPKGEFSIGNTVNIVIPFELGSVSDVLSKARYGYAASIHEGHRATLKDHPKSVASETSSLQDYVDRRVISRGNSMKSSDNGRDEIITLPQLPSDIVQGTMRNDLFQERLQALKTLVVDDTPSNRKMLQRILSNNLVMSDIACDGVDAVDMVRGQADEYDLIFMDYTMPNMVYPVSLGFVYF